MEDTLWAALTDTYVKLPMALTAEKLAEQYSITREQCDAFALQSQQRWANGESNNVQINFFFSALKFTNERCFTYIKSLMNNCGFN